MMKQIYIYGAMIIVGILGGLIFWNFWGCTDNCMINSSPMWSAIRGGLVGGLFAGMFFTQKKNHDAEKKD